MFAFDLVQRGDFQSTSILNQSSKNLEGPLQSTHIEGNYSMKPLEATYETPQLPILMESKKVNTNTPTLPDAIIIVNTRDGEADMIISRRSTYQKILAMENQGVQIVERDLNLPVDIIISAAVCLLLYDSKNIRKKTNSSDDASLLSSLVEIIAANVLTSLSFALSSCILVSIITKSHAFFFINQLFVYLKLLSRFCRYLKGKWDSLVV